MNKSFTIICLLFLPFIVASQNIDYARKKIADLAAEKMYGRGYVNEGDKLAAGYLVDEIKQIGLKKLQDSYRQKYNFPVNTFPGEMKLEAGNMDFKPGYDFQVAAYSKGVEGKFNTLDFPEDEFPDKKVVDRLVEKDLENVFLVIDPSKLDKKTRKDLRSLVYSNPFKARGYIILKDTEKLSWSVSMSRQVKDHTVIEVLKERWEKNYQKIKLNIENKFLRKHKTSNVMGYLPGKSQKDSFVMITAHYDHLGMMGKNVCYCGAHDNASGVAMGLDLARYYAKPENRPEHSLLFVFFSGEEAGLHGSSYFAEHPVVSLDKVKFVMNIDLIGSGSKGIKVVNGAVLDKYFDMLKTINDKKEYIAAVKKRGEAANSDHYPLYAKGVPAFFVYTLGDEYKEYHNPDDRAKGLPLTAYDGLFRLTRDFINAL